MNIIIALLLLGIIIIVHELGHFLAAKFFKMPVEEFGIGFGQELYSYYTGKTVYSLNIIPVGGYVKIDGMEFDSKVENGFNSQSPFRRFVVLGAGVTMNFILSFIVIVFLTFSTGKIKMNEDTIIGEVAPSVKAEKILEKGDIVQEINNISIKNWNEIGKVINNTNNSDVVDVKILRNGKNISVIVPLTEVEGRKILGILQEYEREKVGLKEGLTLSLSTYKRIFNDTFSGLKMLITGNAKSEDISGPVGIIRTIGTVSERGDAGILLWLVAVLSINVGIFNLLPFPALDGGRIIFVLLELVGIKINKKFEERLHQAGMIILFGLIIFATFNDFRGK